MSGPAAYDLSPLGVLLLVGVAVALVPLAWVLVRHRHGDAGSRLRALIWATLFLTFDLVLFGAFTRLSDSGLGCPDWPGCYGHASPFGAAGHIDAAASAQPTGPVTPQKAWIEMAHRYVATGVGALILLMAVLSWVAARRRQATGVSPAWAVATLFWVCLQGAFGALTVTSKLQPAIVTLHLLGGIGLLVLLAAQAANLQPRLNGASRSLVLGVGAVLILVLLQAALGGWVSSNYAVLACRDFPKCQGAWFPPADFAEGFHLWRPLGASAGGGYLPFAALTAIHLTHRWAAVVVLGALLALAAFLWRRGAPDLRRWAQAFVFLSLWQLGSGLGNVLLGWPLAAALAHTAGAAATAVLLTMLMVRAAPRREAAARRRRAAMTPHPAS